MTLRMCTAADIPQGCKNEHQPTRGRDYNCLRSWQTGDVTMPMINRLYAEFLGTAWLVLGGCGSAVLAAGFPGLGIGFMGVALAFGLTVVTMAYVAAPISGAHFNPAVTVGLAFGGRFPWSEVVQYV